MFIGTAATVLCFICMALYIKNTFLTIVFGVIVLSVTYVIRFGLLYPNHLFVESNGINLMIFFAGTAVMIFAILYLITAAIKKCI
jgi:hypothetical protein